MVSFLSKLFKKPTQETGGKQFEKMEDKKKLTEVLGKSEDFLRQCNKATDNIIKIIESNGVESLKEEFKLNKNEDFSLQRFQGFQQQVLDLLNKIAKIKKEIAKSGWDMKDSQMYQVKVRSLSDTYKKIKSFYSVFLSRENQNAMDNIASKQYEKSKNSINQMKSQTQDKVNDARKKLEIAETLEIQKQTKNISKESMADTMQMDTIIGTEEIPGEDTQVDVLQDQENDVRGAQVTSEEIPQVDVQLKEQDKILLASEIVELDKEVLKLNDMASKILGVISSKDLPAYLSQKEGETYKKFIQKYGVNEETLQKFNTRKIELEQEFNSIKNTPNFKVRKNKEIGYIASQKAFIKEIGEIYNRINKEYGNYRIETGYKTDSSNDKKLSEKVPEKKIIPEQKSINESDEFLKGDEMEMGSLNLSDELVAKEEVKPVTPPKEKIDLQLEERKILSKTKEVVENLKTFKAYKKILDSNNELYSKNLRKEIGNEKLQNEYAKVYQASKGVREDFILQSKNMQRFKDMTPEQRIKEGYFEVLSSYNEAVKIYSKKMKNMVDFFQSNF